MQNLFHASATSSHVAYDRRGSTRRRSASGHGRPVTSVGFRVSSGPTRSMRTAMRTAKNFYARPTDEQHWLLRNTWCDLCEEADLGMSDPMEYEEGGVVYVTGKCQKCSATLRSVLSETSRPIDHKRN
jgi:hypothetical protein